VNSGRRCFTRSTGSRATRRMPIAEAWTGADQAVPLLGVPRATARTRPATRERRIWVFCETVPGIRGPVTVQRVRHSPAGIARIAGRSSRYRTTIRRWGYRLWTPIQPLLCRVVRRSRSRPNRFQIRFQIPNCRRQGAASKGPGGADFIGVAGFRGGDLRAEIRPDAVTGQAMKSRPTTGTHEGGNSRAG
jgi:hypothetical protein